MPHKNKPRAKTVNPMEGITNFHGNEDGLLHNQKADNQLQQTIQQNENKAVWGLGYGKTYETKKTITRITKSGKEIKITVENPFEFSMRRLKDDKTIALYPFSKVEEILDSEEIERMGGTSSILSRCKIYSKE